MLSSKAAVLPGAKMKTKSCQNNYTYIRKSSNTKLALSDISHIQDNKTQTKGNSGISVEVCNTWMIGGRLHRWDVETGVTPDLLLDTGVTFLDSDTDEDTNEPPPNKAQRKQQPPVPRRQQVSRSKDNAARVYNRQGASSVLPGGLTSKSNQKTLCIAQDYVMFNRPRTDTCDHFSNLSDEIILHIFKLFSKPQLAKCMEVCKQWRRVAVDDSLWKRLDLKQKTLSGTAIPGILDRGVQALRLANAQVLDRVFPEDSSSHQSALLIGCNRLQFLDLTNANISPDALAELLSLCDRLRNLSLENCVLNDLVCKQIACNSTLEVLNMSMSHGVSPVGISAISAKCHKLHTWNLAWTRLSAQSLDILSTNIPSSMRRLNISGFRDLFTEEHLLSLCHACPSLLELDISSSTSLSSASIAIIYKGFPQLHHLHASHCFNIAPPHFMALCKMQYLRRLEVFGILTDSALAALRLSLPTLEINKTIFSTIARPTTGVQRSTIWGIRV